MSLEELPDMLTVVEAAQFLRIGRTMGYQLAARFLDSGRVEGLPVVQIGRKLRVPRRQIERLVNGELTLGPPAPSIEPPAARKNRSRPAKNRKPRQTSQLSLLPAHEQA